ncbi:Uncharacterized protein Rs2_04201 [Raphanus sativus]|uniref:Uncharacterized protein LOC130508477 n=1 Tax=Raphanus sativus TaxID=3726 RepID=A0A9W3D8A1_RAPSA|nr:uncharacterized protein LOC130508477 [Raphanus sativus]KAJ4909580.1 Uncharacterized protein Rs2_04201 [Raphanus sativus]
MEDQQQQPQFQQPLIVYPSSSSSSSTYAPPSSSGSSGSFGTAFIVLAAILVLAALACVFGRLCNRGRKDNKNNNKASKYEKPSSKKNREIRPVEREPRQRGDDLELGFDVKRPGPMSKPSGRNGGDIEFGFDNKKGGGCLRPNRDDCSARAVWLLASAARPLAKVVTSRVGVSRGADAEPTAPSLMGSKNRRLVVDFDGSARNCPKKRTSAIRYKSSGLMPNNGLSKPGI